jgi:Leucine-rich repeat (LRR) protein
LSLVSNQIERIETTAFDHLPNLNIVLLSDNKLTKWDPNWFLGSPQIAMLNFESNLIERLPTRAFRNVRGVHVVNNRNVSTTIHLNDNKIRIIDDEAFDGLVSLGWLFLQRNEIDVFSQKSLGSLRQLDWLRLDHNRLQCIPERLVVVAPNVKYYLEGNPLTEECIAKFDIKTKSNGSRINKVNFTIDSSFFG